MSEVEQAEQDLKALEAFIVNNPDLERLEALLDQFNIFEAVGMKRQEIRHSRFLAFLFDPNESHGLGDAFIKRLLQQVLMSTPDISAPVTPVELSLWDLRGMVVQREWHYIDIFLLDEQNRLAIIIENKVDTGEHSDQLRRYYEVVQQHHTGYKMICLYLTPTGDEPSHEAYLPLSYGLVCEVLDDLAISQASVLNTDLQILITHYTGMLRRHIVGDSEIGKLSRQIYRKHQRAIDLIYEQRFAYQEAIRHTLIGIIKEVPGLAYNTRFTRYPTGEWISFRIQEWEVPVLKGEISGAYQNCILLFVFRNMPNELSLHLQLGPGDEDTRSRLFSMARDNRAIFREVADTMKREVRLFSRSILTPELYESATSTEREAEIRKNWADFLENDLPRIDAALKQESWIWQETGESE